MASEQNERPHSVRIELTDDQKRRVAEVLGDARVLAERSVALELTAEELERRILPGVALN